MKLELRDYQHDALDRIGKAEARGIRRQLGVAATGLGKTVMFCALAEKRGGRTLVLAHRDELISQAAAKVLEVWPGAQVGVVKAERNDVRAQVVVASVQTLSRQRRLAQLTDAYDPERSFTFGRVEPFDLVVIDEAHHARADSYVAIIEALGCNQPGGPLLLGVTATPDRGDGKGLDDLFDEITFSYDILWGIRAGYLSDLRGLRVTVDDLDLGSVRTTRGDYDAGQSGRAMEDAGAERHVVAGWMEHAMGRRTLVFTPTVETARLVAEEFQHAGIKADYVHGGTPLDDRRKMLADYSAGRLDVLVNCAVLTEGYDEPRTDCIVVARPTKSRALYTQMVGRGTRRHPDKTDCLVLDVVGASDNLSLVTIPSLFGLEKEWAERVQMTGVAEVAQQRDDWLVTQGRLKAEEADLFRTMRAGGTLAWVTIHEPGKAPVYSISLGYDKNSKTHEPRVMLVRVDDAENLWDARLVHPTEPVALRVLLSSTTMEMAQGVGEDYVRKHAPDRIKLLDQSAPWRSRPPSPKAIAAAGKWRMAVDPSWNAGELSDALDAHIQRKTNRKK